MLLGLVFFDQPLHLHLVLLLLGLEPAVEVLLQWLQPPVRLDLRVFRGGARQDLHLLLRRRDLVCVLITVTSQKRPESALVMPSHTSRYKHVMFLGPIGLDFKKNHKIVSVWIRFQDWECAEWRGIDFTFFFLIVDWFNFVTFVETTVVTWKLVCASLNNRKVKKAQPSRLFLLKQEFPT